MKRRRNRLHRPLMTLETKVLLDAGWALVGLSFDDTLQAARVANPVLLDAIGIDVPGMEVPGTSEFPSRMPPSTVAADLNTAATEAEAAGTSRPSDWEQTVPAPSAVASLSESEATSPFRSPFSTPTKTTVRTRTTTSPFVSTTSPQSSQPSVVTKSEQSTTEAVVPPTVDEASEAASENRSTPLKQTPVTINPLLLEPASETPGTTAAEEAIPGSDREEGVTEPAAGSSSVKPSADSEEQAEVAGIAEELASEIAQEAVAILEQEGGALRASLDRLTAMLDRLLGTPAAELSELDRAALAALPNLPPQELGLVTEGVAGDIAKRTPVSLYSETIEKSEKVIQDRIAAVMTIHHTPLGKMDPPANDLLVTSQIGTGGSTGYSDRGSGSGAAPGSGNNDGSGKQHKAHNSSTQALISMLTTVIATWAATVRRERRQEEQAPTEWHPQRRRR